MKIHLHLLTLSLSGLLAVPAAQAGAGCCGSASASTGPKKTETAATQPATQSDMDGGTCPYGYSAKKSAADCAGGACSDMAASKGKNKGDVVSTAADQKNLSTFVSAAQQAGITAELQAEGPYTLFIPSDQAFASLPAGMLDELLKPENKEQLAAILTYHAVPGKLRMKDIQAGEVETVNCAPLELAFTDGYFTAGGAKVVETDITASNGVVYVIDTVLLPNIKTAALTE